MNKKSLSKQEICEQILTPAIEKSGWDRDLQISYCEDVNFVHTQLHTEYVLYYKPHVPVAVISVTENDTEIDAGIKQAIGNAETLDVPCAFSSNGDGFLFYDRTEIDDKIETALDLDDFPSPEQLWEIYKKYKEAKNAVTETAATVGKGQKRLLLALAMAAGAGIIYTAFQIIQNLFKPQENKRTLYLTDRDDYWRNRYYERNKNDWNNQTQQKTADKTPNLQYVRDRIMPLNQMSASKPSGIYWSSFQDLSSNEKSKNYTQLSPDFFDLIIVDRCSSNDNVTKDRAWQEPLKYFKSATQIGFSIGRNETQNNNDDYFGKPIYVSNEPQPKFNEPFSIADLATKESGVNTIHNNTIIENSTNISNNNTNISNTSNSYNTTNNTIINNNVNTKHINNNILINKKSEIMARQTSISYQLELAEDLKRYLHGFQDRLDAVAQNYKNKCNDMYEAGMIDEIYEDFEQNYMEVTIQKIANLVEQINECDIPFVEKFINNLEELGK
jgi:hypothetical protein